MHLYKRTVLISDLIDNENGYYIDPVSLDLDQGACAPPSTVEIESKYNPNPNFGKFKTDYINFVINLEQGGLDIGIYNIFDFIAAPEVDLEPDIVTRIAGIKLEKYLTTGDYYVTGQTESRLNEIDYYGPIQVGVNYSDDPTDFTGVLNKIPTKITYVINGENNSGYVANTGVKYVEYLTEKRIVYNKNTKSYEEINLVNFSAKGQGWTADNVVLGELVKDDHLFGISGITEVENDIDIDRGGYNVFENHYILGEVYSMEDLKNYRNNYFKL